jgi:MFS family permease
VANDALDDSARSSNLGKNGWLILMTLMLATVLANIAGDCMVPHSAALSEEFGRPVNQVVWTMTAFHVVATGVGGVASALGAIFGSKRMLLLTLGLLVIGSLLAALAPSLPVLIAGRILQGASMAVQALAIGIIANHWRADAMRQGMSMIVLAMGLGAVLSYLLSGLIWRSGGTWRTLFWVVAVAGVLAICLTLALIRETKRLNTVRVDYMGCLGLVTWSVLILLPISQANSWGWGSVKFLGMLLPGFAALILWILWELRAASPLIDLRVLKRMAVWQGGVVWLTVVAATIVTAVAAPFLIQAPLASGYGFGRSIFAVSLALAMTAAVMASTSGIATPLIRKLGSKQTMLAGMLIGLIGGFGLAYAHGSLAWTFVWLAAIGIPGALAGSASYVAAAEIVKPEQGILISTIYNTAANIGASAASALAGLVLTLRVVAVPVLTDGGAETQWFPTDTAFTWAMLIVAGLLFVGLVAVLTIRPPLQDNPLAAEGRTADK